MTEVDSGRAWFTAFLGFAAMFVTVGTGFSYGVLVLPVLGWPLLDARRQRLVATMIAFAAVPAGLLAVGVAAAWQARLPGDDVAWNAVPEPDTVHARPEMQ